MIENFDVVIDKATAEQIRYIMSQATGIEQSLSENIRDYLFFSVKEREEQLQIILKKKGIIATECTAGEKMEFQKTIKYHEGQAEEAKKLQQKARKELHEKINKLRLGA